MKASSSSILFLSTFLFTINYLVAEPIYQKNKPLQILFWVKNFPTNTGGSTLNQIIGFIKENHDVTILAQNFNASSINISHPEITQYNLFSRVFIKELSDNNKEFDVIICQSTSRALTLLKFIKKNNIKGRLIVFVRGADLAIFYNHKNYKKIFESFDIIAPVCEYFEKQLTNLNKMFKLKNTDKLKVFHSSIDCDKFNYRGPLLPENKKICIVTTSRLSPKKGLDYAIKAIGILVKKYPNLRYLIIGDGPSREKLQDLIKTLGLERHILLIGWKTPDEVIKLLETSHIFILPSVKHKKAQEGIPNVLKEAMAMGLPVVSTYHAGIPELIENGITGFLVPEKDEDALADKIEFLIEHTEIWNSIVLAGRKFVKKNFDRDEENKKLIKACQKLSRLVG